MIESRALRWPPRAGPLPRRSHRRPDLRAPGAARPPRRTPSSRASEARPPTSPWRRPPWRGGGARRAARARTPGASGCAGAWRPRASTPRWFALVAGLRTPLAFVTVAPDGEPRFDIYGDGIEATIQAVAERLDEAMARRHRAVLRLQHAGRRGRARAHAARPLRGARARPAGRLRPQPAAARWPDSGAAVSAARACLPGAFLVKLNREEARLLTGAAGPRDGGARHPGGGRPAGGRHARRRGAILRGEICADAPGVPAQVVSTVGAGDALAGVLLARLALAGFYPPPRGRAPGGGAFAARVTEQWGAVA